MDPLSLHNNLEVLANCVQACVHLLALGGYGLPVQKCCGSENNLNPPLGDWSWRCSLILDEGFMIGESSNSAMTLNASEMALLQRLLHPPLPRSKKNGILLGPLKVWLKLLNVVELWIRAHLNKDLNSLKLLKSVFISSNNSL